MRSSTPPTPSGFQIHPYRLFFPLGAIGGVLGVGQWIFWSLGFHVPNVSVVHTTLQAQGFLASFVIGFLFTAFPRFTGSPPVPRLSIAFTFGAMLVFFIAAAGFRDLWIAQAAFLCALAGLGSAMVRALALRTKPLIGPFALVGFGLAHAVAGPILILVSRFGEASTTLYSVGRQMVQLGFLLCAVMGVTGKLAPFLMGYGDIDPVDTPLDRLRRSPLAVVLHVAVGLLIATSFILEPFHPRFALFLRAAVVTAHLAVFARFARLPARTETYRVFFSISTWMVALGLWAEALWPVYRVAALHITFIGGFSLMIFSFGSLVVFSHSARAALIAGPMKPLRWIGGAVLLALVLRVSADLSANQYMALIHSASGTWVLAAIGWLIYAMRNMRGEPARPMEPPR